MKCPHCGGRILPKNSTYKEDAYRVLDQLRRERQPFRMNRILKERLARRLHTTPSWVSHAWNLLRNLDELEKVEGYGPTTLWRVKAL